MNEKVKNTAKKVLIGLAFTALSVYMVFAVLHFGNERDNAICMGIDIDIKDSSEIMFIRPSDVKAVIKEMEPDMLGKNMSTLNTTKMERMLVKKLIAIKKVECYKTPDSKLHVNIWQRHPILRIIKNTGYDNYIDTEGKSMPIPSLDPAFVPIATGAINDTTTTRKLYEFALFLQQNKFWNAQIEQIHVKHNGEVNLVPRVGCHIIEMGKLDDYETKLEKLEKLYTEALPRNGWSQYSTVNLKFDQQVICTKK